MSTYETLEKRIGYVFRNKEYLKTALTHSSFANENRASHPDIRCNERLEFLGDSVLSLITSVYLFTGNRNMFEGDLTKIRAGVVCENALYNYATSFGLGEFLKLGKGEENSGGRTRKSILADATEALLAAIYLDGGFECAKKFILPYIVKAADDFISAGNNDDYKTLLQKFVQHARGDVLEYEVVSEDGPSHKRTFEVQVLLNHNVIGKGVGLSKRAAEQEAAKKALALFGKLPSGMA